MRYMSGGKLTVPLVMRAPVGATGRGAQHAQNLESFFLNVPGIKDCLPRHRLRRAGNTAGGDSR